MKQWTTQWDIVTHTIGTHLITAHRTQSFIGYFCLGTLAWSPLKFRWEIVALSHCSYVTVICSYTVRSLRDISKSRCHWICSLWTWRNRQSLSYSRISQTFMQPEGSILYSQKLSTGPHPEPDQSSPYHTVLSKFHFNIIHSPTSFLLRFHQYPICIRFSPVRATCSFHHILLDLIILIILGASTSYKPDRIILCTRRCCQKLRSRGTLQCSWLRHCAKPEGRGVNFWCHWTFQST
jgi:hypothetical protein